MLIDASAIIAVLNEEHSADEIKSVLANQLANNAPFYIIGTSIFEAVIGLAQATTGRRRQSAEEIAQAHSAVRAFLEALRVKELGLSADMTHKAIEAAAKYGKASGHAADLNFGDCFVYAATKSMRLPLLYIGNDFSETDVHSALASSAP